MGIDGIGKRGAPPAAGTDGAAKAEKTEKAGKTTTPDAPFSLERAAPTQAADAVSGTSPLGRLRAGEVDVNGYVDLKVDEATRDLHGLSPAEVSDIKRVLRDQMASDPALTDLVHRATGAMPAPPNDDE